MTMSSPTIITAATAPPIAVQLVPACFAGGDGAVVACSGGAADDGGGT